MTKVTIDRALIEQALETLEIGDNFRPGLARVALRAALAEPAVEPSTDDSSVLSACQKLAQAFKTSPPPPPEPAVEPVACTNKQAMEVRNSIGLMKNEDERNNYGNHATAIKVLEAFLTSPPPTEPAPVPLLSDEEINESFKKLTGYNKPTKAGVAFARAIEQVVRRKAGL